MLKLIFFLDRSAPGPVVDDRGAGPRRPADVTVVGDDHYHLEKNDMNWRDRANMIRRFYLGRDAERRIRSRRADAGHDIDHAIDEAFGCW